MLINQRIMTTGLTISPGVLPAAEGVGEETKEKAANNAGSVEGQDEEGVLHGGDVVIALDFQLQSKEVIELPATTIVETPYSGKEANEHKISILYICPCEKSSSTSAFGP